MTSCNRVTKSHSSHALCFFSGKNPKQHWPIRATKNKVIFSGTWPSRFKLQTRWTGGTPHHISFFFLINPTISLKQHLGTDCLYYEQDLDLPLLYIWKGGNWILYIKSNLLYITICFNVYLATIGNIRFFVVVLFYGNFVVKRRSGWLARG